MSDTVEANVSRLGHAADMLVESCVELEAAGGLGAALAGRRPRSRAEFLERLEQAKAALDGLLAEARSGRSGPHRGAGKPRAEHHVPIRGGIRLPGDRRLGVYEDEQGGPRRG